MRQINKKNLQYAFFSLIFATITNQIAYQGSKLIAGHNRLFDVSMPIDHTFKLIPWTIIIYFGSYLIWSVCYLRIAMQDDRAKSEKFFSAVLLSHIFCLIFFVVFPTTADIRPVIEGNSGFDRLMVFLYNVDISQNYFPSLHCMASTFCVLGMLDKKEFSLSWRIFAYVQAIAVYISTITTRQHVLIDIPGGIVFGILFYEMSDYRWVQTMYTKASTWLVKHLFRWDSIEG